MCSPQLLANRANPLKKAADLARHTSLAVDTSQGMAFTGDWEPWLRVMVLSEVRTKNTLRFTQYADVVGAAMAGQGVATSQRGYFVALGSRAASNPDAQDFARWLRAERHSWPGQVLTCRRSPALAVGAQFI